MAETISNELPLSAEALLYAGDALSDADAAAFECRLGEEQHLRDALVQAVGVLQTMAEAPRRPDPAYRAVVQAHAASRRGGWRRWFARRSYAGHPLVWSLGGAAAAILFMFGLPLLLPSEATPAPVRIIVVHETKPAEPMPAENDVASNEALIFAEFPQAERLLKVHEEDARRRLRAPVRPVRPRDEVVEMEQQ